MKKAIFAAIVAVSVIGCKKAEKRNVTPETYTKESSKEQVLNFSKIENKVDSTLVNLRISGDKAEGKMLWLPDGKDSKVGIIHGNRTENGDWGLIFDYFQEGQPSSDSLLVSLNEKQMIIKNGWEINSQTKVKTELPYLKDTLDKKDTDVIPEYWNKRIEGIFKK